MKLFTLGHSNLPLDAFIELLRENGVTWIADVRSSPYSGRCPWFNRKPLTESLRAAGINYLFIGDRIGGKPSSSGTEGSKWTQGKLRNKLVSELSQRDRWKEGIEFLADIVKRLNAEGRFGAILCSESDPNNCHRSLVSFELEQAIPALSITHLRQAGRYDQVTFQKAFLKVSDGESNYH